MENEFRYSIIVPHYNIPLLLKRCLYSIPKRDDLQIIVVDDKSTDENINKLKNLELLFPYVSFIYSEINGGGGKARNVGLKYARGAYVLFADADDFFNYCINDILDEYKDKTYDVVFFNASFIDTETYLPTMRGTTLKWVVEEYKRTSDMNLFRYVSGEPWSKLIKKELITNNNIEFEESIIHNDTKFSYLVGFYAETVRFDNKALYCLADRSESVSKGIADSKWFVRTRIFAEKNRFLIDHKIPLFDNLMIKPFWYYAKKRDWANYRHCLSIVKEYGFSRGFILKKLCKKFLLALRVKIRRLV